MRYLASVIIVFLLLLSTMGATGWYITHQSPDPTLVTNLQDDGPGSLRWAIADAPAGSTITFNKSVRGIIRLTSGDLTIAKQKLEIRGPGPSLLAISSGIIGYRVIVSIGISVIISNLAFKDSTNQIGDRSAGITGSGFIYNQGTLTLNSSTITGNLTADSAGGGIYNQGTLILNNSVITANSALAGGGIYNLGTLTLNNSTIAANSAVFQGGGIFNEAGTFTLNNSTIAANSAGFDGGGIFNEGMLTNSTSNTLTLNNSTISDNRAERDGGGIYNNSSKAEITFCTIYGNVATVGGGISIEDKVIDSGKPIQSQVTISNSIVAENHAHTGPNISGKLTSDGYNLIQNTSGVTFSDPHNKHATDIIAGASANLGIDLHLQDNGGSTQPHTWTHKLLQGSPAIDVIPLDACLVDGKPSTDQRGVKRPQGARCDVGAYEYP